MSIQARKERQKEEVRTAILEAARKIAESEGWEAVSLRKIAEIIEYSAPLIYSYFSCKEAILLEFVKQGCEIQCRAMRKAKETAEDPAGQLLAMAMASWHFVVKKQLYYQLMYGVKVAPCAISCNEVAAARQELRDIVYSTVQTIIAQSDKPDTNPEIKLLAFWSIVHGVASLYIARVADRRMDEYKAILEDGILGIIRTLEV